MAEIIDSSRRSFLQLGLTALVCSAAPPVVALPRVKDKDIRALAFRNLHTDEKLSVTYWKDGRYAPGAAEKINHILRDHYSGDVYPINLRLMDLLHDLQRKVNNDAPVEIISGYRSPKTNLRLASASHGVAKQSYHTKGMAIDIRMSGTSLGKLHKAALEMGRGGVGYYPDSQFVHIDVGPVRKW